MIYSILVQPKTITQGLGSGKDLYIPKDLSEMAVLSGMPAEHAQRTVIIAPRILKSLQSGGKYANQWQISWPNQARWSNGLMGWTGTSDPMSNVKVSLIVLLLYLVLLHVNRISLLIRMTA